MNVREKIRALLQPDSKEVYWDRIGYTPHSGQLDFHASTARFKTLTCGRRFGKALALDTPLPTPSGWTTMGEIQPGDVLFDEQGRTSRVSFATEVMLGRPCYEVRFSDGSSIVADEDHLWLTWDKAYRKSLTRGYTTRWSEPRVLTTGEIRHNLWAVDDKEHNYSIPLAASLVLPEHLLPIAPYTLGAWLGDGTSRGPMITTVDEEVLDEIRADGYEVRPIKVSGGRTPGYRFGKLSGKYRDDGLFDDLRRLNLLQNKHIPAAYLRGSHGQRLALLQGLMDTDGHASKTGHVEFTSTKVRLASDVLELVISLGMKATMSEGRATLDGKDCGSKYRVTWTAHEPVFRLPRKLQRLRLGEHPRLWTSQRYIVDVAPVPSVPVRCITVDSPSHLYLAGRSMVPTHNTISGVRDIGPLVHIPDLYIWVVGPTQGLAVKEFRLFQHDLRILQRKGFCKLEKDVLDVIGGRYLLKVRNGATIEVRSQEKEDQMVGEGVGAVIMAEAARLKPHIWTELIRPTLGDFHGVAVFSTTPRGRNWYYDLVEKAKGSSQWATFQKPSWDNEVIYPGGKDDPEILELRETLPEIEFDQEIAANFTSHAGLIYTEFDMDVHVQRFEPLPEVPFTGWVDMGFSDPFVCLLVQVPPEGPALIHDEYYFERMTPAEHAGRMEEWFDRDGSVHAKPEVLYCDPRSPDGIKDLKLGGWEAKAARSLDRRTQSDNPVIVGVKVVKRLLKIQKYTGAPAILVHPRCKMTIKEFGAYEWVNDQPDPKKNNHAMDAIRYGVISEISRNRPGIDIDDESEEPEPDEEEVLGQEEPEDDDYDPDEPYAMQRLRQRKQAREKARR